MANGRDVEPWLLGKTWICMGNKYRSPEIASASKQQNCLQLVINKDTFRFEHSIIFLVVADSEQWLILSKENLKSLWWL